jgi:hypothetical protein
MKKIFKILLWIIIVVIVIFACLAYIGMKYGPSKDVSDTQDCTKIYSSYDANNPGEDLGRNYCYSSLAIKKHDITYCSKINNTDDRTLCEAMFASTPDQCETVKEKDQCFIGFATLNKDQSICERTSIDQRKDDCYLGVAVAANDASICSKIKTDNYYDAAFNYTCFAITRNDPSICEKAKDEIYGTINVDECYLQLSIAKNDLNMCDKIYDPYQKSFCKNRTKGILVSPGLIGQ